MNKLKIKGFTIVELMIVIAVMAVLATVGFFTFSNIQTKARDAKRKTELTGLAKALQAYSAEKGNYPVSATLAVAGTAIGTELDPYGGKVPVAPTSSSLIADKDYNYLTDADGKAFALCAQVEDKALCTGNNGTDGCMLKVTSNDLTGSYENYTAFATTCTTP